MFDPTADGALIHRYADDKHATRCGLSTRDVSLKCVTSLVPVTCEVCRRIEYVEPAPVLPPPLTPLQAEWERRVCQMFAQLKLPSYMLHGVADYLLHGLIPGGFLTSVLCNDFRSALGRADDANADAIVGWIHSLTYLPAECFGSRAAVDAWAKHQGLLYQERTP